MDARSRRARPRRSTRATMVVHDDRGALRPLASHATARVLRERRGLQNPPPPRRSRRRRRCPRGRRADPAVAALACSRTTRCRLAATPQHPSSPPPPRSSLLAVRAAIIAREGHTRDPVECPVDDAPPRRAELDRSCGLARAVLALRRPPRVAHSATDPSMKAGGRLRPAPWITPSRVQQPGDVVEVVAYTQTCRKLARRVRVPPRSFGAGVTTRTWFAGWWWTRSGTRVEDGQAQVRQGGGPRFLHPGHGRAPQDVLRRAEGGPVRRQHLRQRRHALLPRRDVPFCQLVERKERLARSARLVRRGGFFADVSFEARADGSSERGPVPPLRSTWKRAVAEHPERYIHVDEALVPMLRALRESGKKTTGPTRSGTSPTW